MRALCCPPQLGWIRWGVTKAHFTMISLSGGQKKQRMNYSKPQAALTLYQRLDWLLSGPRIWDLQMRLQNPSAPPHLSLVHPCSKCRNGVIENQACSLAWHPHMGEGRGSSCCSSPWVAMGLCCILRGGKDFHASLPFCPIHWAQLLELCMGEGWILCYVKNERECLYIATDGCATSYLFIQQHFLMATGRFALFFTRPFINTWLDPSVYLHPLC